VQAAGDEAESPPPPMPMNVLLVGWDGCDREHVKSLLKDGRLPNLQKLIERGRLVDIDIGEYTDTKGGWAQILTGYTASVTGVYHNAKYQPIPRGLTIWERLREAYGSDRIATVAVIAKKKHLDADPPRELTPEELEKLRSKAGNSPTAAQPGKNVVRTVPSVPGCPYFLASQSMDWWANDLGKGENVTAVAIQMLDRYQGKPFFFFVHYAEPDVRGHGFGESSPQYDDAIVACDRELGRLVEKLAALKQADKTLIYVTSDHGFDAGAKTHWFAPYVFLATNDAKVNRAGGRADITPTILDRLGLNLRAFRPALTGESLARPITRPVPKPAKKPVFR